MLREFHSLPAPTIDLRTWDPVGATRKRIADAKTLAATDRQTLRNWCDRLEPEVDALVAESAGTVTLM